MSDTPEPWPNRADERALHERLLQADPTAPADLAAHYLEPLIAWLHEHNRSIDQDFCNEAAEDTLLALIKDPGSYRRDRQTLAAYLRMSAQGDLQNLLHREQRHHRQRVSWETVELSSEAGKYLGRDEDPSLPLQLLDEGQAVRNAVPPSVWAGLTGAEGLALELMLQGERKTSAYAAVLGITHMPTEEQEKEAKRVKDRLKKRLERAGGSNEPTS